MNAELQSQNIDRIESQEVESELDQRLGGIEKSFGRFGKGYDIFDNYIRSLPENKQEEILGVFEDKKNKRELLVYLKKEGNPFPSDQTINIFEDRFFDKATVQEDIIKNKETHIIDEKEQEQSEENKTKIDKIAEITKKYEVFSEKLLKIENGNRPDEVQEFIIKVELLSNDKLTHEDMNEFLTQEVIATISRYLIKQQGVDGEAYQSFKSLAIELNPGLETVFNDFEQTQKNIEENTTGEGINELEKAIIGASFYNGSGLERKGDFLVNGDIKLDLGTKPPMRYLQLEGSDYALKTKLSVGDFSKAVLEYERAIQVVKPDVEENQKSIDEGKSKMKKIGSADFTNKEQLADVFGVISNMHDLKGKQELIGRIEELDDTDPIDKQKADQLKNDILDAVDHSLQPLYEQRDNLHTQVEEIKSKYRLDLEAMKAAYTLKLKEKDEKTREVLRFIKSIGFDILPQSFTDQIISELKANSLDVNGMTIDVNNIDIANGHFGESPTEQNATKWKENLAMFFNKMISGNTGEPLDIESHIGVMGKTQDPTELKGLLKEYGVLGEGDAVQYSVVRDNLRKENDVLQTHNGGVWKDSEAKNVKIGRKDEDTLGRKE